MLWLICAVCFQPSVVSIYLMNKLDKYIFYKLGKYYTYWFINISFCFQCSNGNTSLSLNYLTQPGKIDINSTLLMFGEKVGNCIHNCQILIICLLKT